VSIRKFIPVLCCWFIYFIAIHTGSQIKSLAVGEGKDPSQPPASAGGQLPPPLRLRSLTASNDQEPPAAAPPAGGPGSEAATTHSPLEASQHAHNVADLNSALNVLR
jgi:hypothetical protein